jgi:sulfur dioxygenase
VQAEPGSAAVVHPRRNTALAASLARHEAAGADLEPDRYVSAARWQVGEYHHNGVRDFESAAPVLLRSADQTAKDLDMIFRQLFEPVSSTYTYLLGCPETRQAVLIDPVMPAWQRDLAVVHELGLKLMMTIDTHIHADHITSAAMLKREAGSRIGIPALDALPCTDVPLQEGVPVEIGGIRLQPMHTPGHTDNHFSIVGADRVFTGDALLIDGCGRTDFQSGDAHALYRSVRGKLFSLPIETLVYPAHDYQGRWVSSIAQEKQRNPRLGGERTLEDFVELMRNLDLPYPKFIDYAVPGNRQCGVCPEDLPEQLRQYCQEMAESPQG